MNNFGILWDMDGVLVDTGELHYQAWAETLAEIGMPLDREAFRGTFGMNNRETLTLWLGRAPEPELLARIGNRKEERFRQAAHGRVETLPGVRPWLQRFQAEGFRQAVASSAPPANIEVLVDELGLRPYFSALVSAADLPSKPNPAVFLEAARRLDLPAERCIIIEDSLPGIEAARRANMKCLAVATTNPPQALKAANLVVERLNALTPDLFHQLFPA